MRRQRQAWNLVRTSVFVLCVKLLIAALIPTVIRWAPHWLASTSGLNAEQRADEIGRVRTALLATFAGVVAVVGAIYTARTFALNREGQITDRFTRAVDQLANRSLDVRLGGIYALERVARDSRKNHGPIVEIMTAYVREHAPAPTRVKPAPLGVQKGTMTPDVSPNEAIAVRPATDVQAALTVLGRRTRASDMPGRLLLAHTDLTGADLQKAHLEEANLEGAHLGGAFLWSAHLEGAVLLGTHMEGAFLDRTHLKGALYNQETTWPEEFDPASRGAILVATAAVSASALPTAVRQTFCTALHDAGGRLTTPVSPGSGGQRGAV